MWGRLWRAGVLDEIARTLAAWDVIVVGGGIAGAGVFREAVRHSLRTLLLEGGDFASGTSSRSSKLVHGGIRYLQHGHWRLTRESLRERDRLLREAPGLVEPLFFVRPVYARESRWLYRGAFLAYGLLAGRRQHTYYDAAALRRLAPSLASEGVVGAYGYQEAAVDDARLVLRLIREGVRAGGCALSYCAVDGLVVEDGTVAGVRARDVESGGPLLLRARAVVNATGTRVDHLRREVGAKALIRPLRGSHLVFPADRLPMEQALSFRHPRDGRHVFACSWEGATLVGTTDGDHDRPLDEEPRASAAEVAYLMDVVTAYFPSLRLDRRDVIATWAGVRPVVGTQRADPSAESREGLLLDERGLVSVTGGKLTTVRATALAALQRVRHRLPDLRALPDATRLFDEVDAASVDHPALDRATRRRLLGHYGGEAADLLAAAREGELARVPGTRTLWAQVRFAARAEGVTHLDDLLLRRVRIGMVLPEGGAALLGAVRAAVQDELGWTDEKWRAEETAYRARWPLLHAAPGLPATPS
ncbi:MAG TPA: glycerol-3-phosphate dehydrogenase/oxidase [Vicinamibacteria bacterium]|nr:glycerol-3-phosphate dehydrogenase/oxidase [Vicinamibacteria bacterium]